ncbi:MAG: TldD/PmbA family protein [Candidatus Heimdallarchaeaceae archaeon]
MNTNELNEKISKALEIGLKFSEKEGAAECEAFGLNLKLINLELEKNKPKNNLGIQHGIAFRVIANKAIGFAYTSSFDEKDIQHTVRLAIQNAKSKKPDKDLASLPTPKKANKELPFDENLYSIDLETAANLFDELHKIELPKNLYFLQSMGFFGLGDSFLKNTQGVDLHTRDAGYGFGLAYLSTHGFPNYEFYIEGARKLGEINPEGISIKAREKTLKSAKPHTLSLAGEYPVILSPEGSYGVFGGLFTVLEQLLSGDKASRGETIFADKIGEQIAPENFTLIDNPLDPTMVMSTSFDGEGIPTEETILIENGILKTYYIDSYYARKLNMESNGKAQRGGVFSGNPVKSPPKIGSFNTFIQPGNSSLEEIIQETKEGFLLKNFMGIHMSDLSSGRFAVTGTGWYIKKGEIKYPVQDISISGTIPDLLMKIDMISKEREKGLNSYVPYLRVNKLSVTSKRLDFKIRFGLKVLKALIKLKIAKNPFI